jgi:hypothetical protein
MCLFEPLAVFAEYLGKARNVKVAAAIVAASSSSRKIFYSDTFRSPIIRRQQIDADATRVRYA